jgi:hypothetical protein
LTEEELVARLRALDELAAGKLRPSIQSQGDGGSKGSTESNEVSQEERK